MYKDHPAFEDPKNSALMLWRYMDLARFLSLLDSSNLYFSRASEFRKNDPFEGSFPKLEYEYLKKNQGETVTTNIYTTSSNIIYVNCWHLSEYESIAMWKLYSESNKGIAIKTSVSNFKESFENSEEDIFAGMVQYIDFEEDTYYSRSGHKYYSGNLMTPYIHKRNIFEYEKEYRAIYSANNRPEEKGFNIKVELNKLIEEVVLAPYFPVWLFDFIKKITNNYLPDININKSIFESKPYI